jgi:hypothetical protein
MKKMKLLDKARYKDIIPIIQSADINTLFALSVLEGKIDGRVFVDTIDLPSSIVLHMGMNRSGPAIRAISDRKNLHRN